MQEQIQLQNLKIQNRYLRSATACGLIDENGRPMENYYRFYQRIAKSAPGILVNEITTISEDGHYQGFITIRDDESIQYHKRFNDLIKKETDGKTITCSQICHSGTTHNINYYKTEDFKQIIQDFVQAAIRSEKSGYDIIQLHSAHQYLLSQSISNYYNKRTDEYNAQDFLLLKQVFEEVKKAVSIPVGIKINSIDFIEGYTMNNEQLKKIIQTIPFDFVELSGGSQDGKHPTMRKDKNDTYYYEPQVQYLKDIINDKFLIVTGGFNGKLIDEERALNQGVKMIGYSRLFIRQPDFVQKKVEDRKECIRCNGCLRNFKLQKGAICVFDKEW